ncbi:hypothetical protein V5093_04855 [Enterobacter cancerogenus]|nr:hypothetical protein [Enterobacter cancerogenus]
MVKKIMLLFVVMLLAACDVNDADVASRNFSKAADSMTLKTIIPYRG